MTMGRLRPFPCARSKVPPAFETFLTEPAFNMSDCTFTSDGSLIGSVEKFYFQSVLRTTLTDRGGLLLMFDDKPETCIEFASECYEKVRSGGPYQLVSTEAKTGGGTDFLYKTDLLMVSRQSLLSSPDTSSHRS
jgi:hypothetical protein